LPEKVSLLLILSLIQCFIHFKVLGKLIIRYSLTFRRAQKKLSGHPNIVQFIAAASIGKEQSDHGQAEFLILTELCTGENFVQVELCVMLLAILGLNFSTYIKF